MITLKINLTLKLWNHEIDDHFVFFLFLKMGTNRELTVAERSQIIGLFKGGHKKSEISKILGFKISTVKKTIQRYGHSEMPVSKKRSGRPKLLGEDEKNILKEIITSDNRTSASNMKESFYQSTGLNVSTKTIYRNLVSILTTQLQNHFLMINNVKIVSNGALIEDIGLKKCGDL